MSLTIKVKELPPTLQAALESVGYHRADIVVRPSETYTMRCSSGGNGYRSFVCAVDMGTGARKVVQGSWGGANMFNPDNPVDLDDTKRPLPPNFAVITGSEGGIHPTYASVEVNPATLNPLLSAPVVQLSAVDGAILSAIAGLNSGGRKNQFARWRGNAASAADPSYRNYPAQQKAQADCAALIEATITSLVGRGLLARNKAGSVSVTTAGKNARTGGYTSMHWFPGAPDAPALTDGVA